MQQMTPQAAPTVRIEKIVTGGVGLARLDDGRVVLVPGAITGEKVAVFILRRKKDYAMGAVREILEPAADRVRPRCDLHGECGGCDFGHIAADRQLHYKEEALREQLARGGAGAVPVWQDIVQPPLASENTLHYRWRIRLHGRGGVLGFNAPKSREIVPISKCLLAEEPINAALAALAGWRLSRRLAAITESLEIIAAREQAILVWAGRRPDGRLLADLSRLPAIRAVALRGRRQWWADGIVRRGGWLACGYELECIRPARTLVMEQAAGGFTQINRSVNAAMVNRMLDWLTELRPHAVLDLYCGNGNLAVPAALVAARVVGVEQHGVSIEFARRNAARAGLTNCRFLAAGAEQAVAAMVGRQESYDLVILDPPRQGGAAIARRLADLGCRSVLYISCDPATLVRDLTIMRQSGFVPVKLCVADMFPQTHHLETMVLLVR